MYLKDSCQNNQTECNPLPVPFNLSSFEAKSLFEDILNKGLTVCIKATGRSMAPFLIGGEILTIKKVRPSSLHTGDMIFFRDSRGFPVLHRIVRRKRKNNIPIFQTKGDALLSADEPVCTHDVLGKVSGIEKMLPDGKAIHIDMECLLQRSINFFLAITGLYRGKVCFAIQKSKLYSSLRSLVKKTLS